MLADVVGFRFGSISRIGIGPDSGPPERARGVVSGHGAWMVAADLVEGPGGPSARPHKLPSHGFERRPWRALAQGIDETFGPLSAIRELVTGVPPPRRDHREDEGAALAQQRLINVCTGVQQGPR